MATELAHHRLEVSTHSHHVDARGVALARQICSEIGVTAQSIRTRDVFSVFAAIDQNQAQTFAEAVTNSITQNSVVGESDDFDFDWLVVVGFHAGVTDNVARTAVDAFADALDRPLAETEKIYSSIEYLIKSAELSRPQVEEIASTILANPLINNVTVLSRPDWRLSGTPINQPEVKSDEAITVDRVDLDGLDDKALISLSKDRLWALSLEEMKAVREFFQQSGTDAKRQELGLDGQPTDVEIEMVAQAWSEHCKHKIFDAIIDYTDDAGDVRTIDSCYRSFIKKSTREIGEEVDWLVSVFEDNAGVIRYNDTINLVYKVETHNSPSALDPYGGSMTGIVGVNRDPMGTGIGADLLINVWGFCLASPFTEPEDVPQGLMHPRRIRDGVHKGCIDGGNQSGIPYGIGWEYFDERYLGKPLVFCGTVGTLPRTVAGAPGHEKSIEPGDLIVVGGGRIGKDGIHGATFSSEDLSAESPVQAVQIGDPITQKKLADFVMEARDLGMYRFITDNGAGGLSCSAGEMATNCNGCHVELAEAPLKYAGLQPWEILLSEAQERMTFAVPPENIEAFKALAATRDVEVNVVGEFTDTGKYHVTYNGDTVAYVDLDFVHDGYPRMHLQARWKPPTNETPPAAAAADLGDSLLALLARLNIASGEYKARQYDHEVKGLSVVKPYVGVCNDVLSDAVVLMLEPTSREGIILAAGVLPRYSDIDTYHMTASVIDLAVRRSIAVGGQLGHMAGLDNFCWPDPVQSEKTPDGEYKLAQLVRSNQALYDYTKAYKVPCISGKDSMKNDSTRGGCKISIPPTLLFSTIARMPDVSKALTLDVKRVGDLVYVLGVTRDELGGSEFYAMYGGVGNDVPQVDAAAAGKLYDCVARATAAEQCHSLHSPAVGGLAAGFARIAMGGRLGLDINLEQIPTDGEPLEAYQILFSESNSRFIATVPPADQAQFEATMDNVPWACVGAVKYEPTVTFYYKDALEAEVGLTDLVEAYHSTLEDI